MATAAANHETTDSFSSSPPRHYNVRKRLDAYRTRGACMRARARFCVCVRYYRNKCVKLYACTTYEKQKKKGYVIFCCGIRAVITTRCIRVGRKSDGVITRLPGLRRTFYANYARE